MSEPTEASELPRVVQLTILAYQWICPSCETNNTYFGETEVPPIQCFRCGTEVQLQGDEDKNLADSSGLVETNLLLDAADRCWECLHPTHETQCQIPMYLTIGVRTGTYQQPCYCTFFASVSEVPPERVKLVVRAATKNDWIGVAYCKDYAGDPSTIHEYARVRPAPSVEVRRCKICELLESAPEHAATMCVCSKGGGGCHCWFVRVGPIPTVAQPAPSTTDAERVRELVDEWDKNNAITLLGDHRDDLNDRILSLISEVRNESLQVTARFRERSG